MTNLVTAIAILVLASSAQGATVLGTDRAPLGVAKHLVYALDDLSYEAEDEAFFVQQYDWLGAKKLKFLASRADKLAGQVVVKVIESGGRGVITKPQLAAAYKSLAHDIKNYQNALRKIHHPTRSLLAKARKVEHLLEDLKDLALGRGRIDACRGNRCQSH